MDAIEHRPASEDLQAGIIQDLANVVDTGRHSLHTKRSPVPCMEPFCSAMATIV